MITINVIAGDKEKDEFMHMFDLFEPFKHLGEALSIEYADTHVPTIEKLAKLKKVFEEGNYIVSSLWYAQKPEIHIVNWDTKVISNGTGWCMHHDYLKQFGILKPEDKQNG